MALFGKSNEKKAQDVQIEIKTQNSWLVQRTPKAIVRQIINRGLEKTMNMGCDYVRPYILMKDCVRVVETDQTFEIQTKKDGFKIIPKTQIIEIQYFD